MSWLSSFVKKVKKKVTLKGVISGVTKGAAALTVVGGFLQSTAGAAAAAQQQASQAQAQAEQQLQAAAASGAYTVPDTGPQPAGKIDTKLVLIGAAALVAVFLIARRK